MRRLLSLAFIGGVVASCTSESSPKDQSSLACNHFRNVSGDAAAGILTDAELREKLKEVNDNATIATDAVKEAARDMLAAATRGNSSALLVAGNAMDAACKAAGH